MPKRSRGKKKARKGPPDAAQKKKKMRNIPDLDENESDIDFDDEIDKFHANRDKIALDSDDDAQHGEKEEEVLAVVSDSPDEEDEEKQMKFYKKQLQNLQRRGLVKGDFDGDSDEESEEEEEEDEEADLPSRQAWGDKRSRFYGTDVRDAKIGLGHEEREGLAVLEEREALELQKRQRARYTEEDLALDTVFGALESSDDESQEESKKGKKKRKKTKTKAEEDGSPSKEEEEAGDGGSSKRRKSSRLALQESVEKVSSKLMGKERYERVTKQHPEFEVLYKEMFDVARDTSQVSKILELVQEGSSQETWPAALKYLALKVKLGNFLLLYTLLYVRMVLESFPTRDHPVMEKINRYRSAWKALRPLDQRFRPSVDVALGQLERGEVVTFGPNLGGTSSLKRKLETTKSSQKAKKAKTEEAAGEKAELPPWVEDGLEDSEEEEEEEKEEGETDGEEEEGEEEVLNREATKKMEKNEGLKAYKKRKQKHARTKNREKFRKAKIRRKGQVRDYRPELTKYGGEASGIRAGVIRSRRL